MNYDLSHLTQDHTQRVLGPIQDDEALLLFALCKSMIIKNVVEIGVQSGYSTLNFVKAVGEDGNVISFDVDFFNKKFPNFTFIHKNAANVEESDIPWEIDLVFFDSHDEMAQLSFYDKMTQSNKITDRTVIVVHDTNLHPDGVSFGIRTDKGWIHQPNEWNFVNKLISKGWAPFHVHTKIERHNANLPYRHGLTFLTKKTYLKV